MHPFQNHLIEYISGKKLMNRWRVDYFEMKQLYPQIQHILKVRYDEGSMRELIIGLGSNRPIPAAGLSIGIPKHLAPIRFPQTEKTLKLAVFKLTEVEAVEKTYFEVETDKIEHCSTKATSEDETFFPELNLRHPMLKETVAYIQAIGCENFKGDDAIQFLEKKNIRFDYPNIPKGQVETLVSWLKEKGMSNRVIALILDWPRIRNGQVQLDSVIRRLPR